MTAAAPSDRSSAVARRLLWCVLLVAGLALALRLLPRPRTIDDAYITFRYARNIVEGQGFVYNPGVRTLGTTTPLYTLLMAAIGAITGSEAYPWFALGVNALADAITAGLLALLAWRVSGRLAPEMAWHKLELLYQEVGEQIRATEGVDQTTLVAAGDIGAIGYYSEARILDTIGLVTPEMAAYYPVDKALLIPGANYAVPPDLILDYRPEFVVLMESFVRNGLAQDPRFTARYAQERFIPTDFYGTGMILYRLREDRPVADAFNLR